MTFKQLILFLLAANLAQIGNTTCKPDSSSKSFTNLSIKCEKTDSVNNIILEAINIGAPTYNAGNYLGCYRIYEGASYKILYQYANSCIRVSQILKDALQRSCGNFSASDKAWIMRGAFDEILGEPTRTK